MSFLAIIGLLVLAVIFLVLMSLGLVVVFGVLVVGGIFLGAAYLIFGSGSLGSFTTVFGGHAEANKIPQEFNHCLLGDDLQKCREDFTTWTPDQMELINQLAKQVKNDLGERLEETTESASFRQGSTNGDTTITMDQTTDFTIKKGVQEHYVIVSGSTLGKLKIKDLKWDYEESPKP